jgi:radical SAM superfamily enzyme YgiQ (UPF0313 family)
MRKTRVHMVDLKSYYQSPAYQLGLLVAYARVDPDVRKAVDFVFTEHPREQSVEDIAAAIVKADSDLVCISNYAWTYKTICRVLDLLTRAKADLPRLVLGGPSCAGRMGDEILNQYSIVSALVDGEGEPAFLDICRALVGNPRADLFATARNCAIRGEGGSVVRANMNHRIQQLDDIPSPYLTGIIPPGPVPVFYETNRGCPYRCAFCYWGNGNSRVFRLSHARIREELEFFAQNKVSAFWLSDANFGMFADDEEIADMLAEINARHGFPFAVVGVNWAKNSSDRVLEIASTLKRGRMRCTTTLALQTVTRAAEQASRRYSMKPSRFVGLISSAEERGLDTYTDILWGLPGESVEEYIDGVDAVAATGVPVIFIHQLYLLPGTELYNDRDTLGLVIGKTCGDEGPDPSERSDYYDYMVVEHPKMRRDDWVRGNRIQAINHVLHNHDLGRVVAFYLARYGKTQRDIYEFFERLLLEQVSTFPEERHPILSALRSLIIPAAATVGLDEIVFYRRLSDTIWFSYDKEGSVSCAEPQVRAFMQEFFRAFCQEHGICATRNEARVLADIVKYNVLISPKPAWRPRPHYVFSYDVHRIWQDMLAKIFEESEAVALGEPEESSDTTPLAVMKGGHNSWHDRARQVRGRLSRLLTDDYVGQRRGPRTYTIENPWVVPPARSNLDWIFSSRSRHCGVVDAVEVKATPNVIQLH